MNNTPWEDILRSPCPYNPPPLEYLGGHAFCPCISNAIRAAYIGGYSDGKEDKELKVGVVKPSEFNEEIPNEGC